MASADFSASSFRRYRRPWPFRADGEISRNKTHFFRPAGCGFTTLLRLGLGLRLVLQTCPQVGLVSAFCAYPPNFASDFLHPRPRGRKLVLGYLVPPNWPIGDFHSRPCVMSCVQRRVRRPFYRRTIASLYGMLVCPTRRASFAWQGSTETVSSCLASMAFRNRSPLIMSVIRIFTIIENNCDNLLVDRITAEAYE